MSSLTVTKVKELGVKGRDAERSKNFFALGLLCWMYSRNPEDLRAWIEDRFSLGRAGHSSANLKAFEVGYSFGETTELIPVTRSVAPVERPPGTYRNINGNTGLAWGIIASAQLSGLPTYLGSYPDHPGVGHAPRAGQAPRGVHPHLPGGGRDRRSGLRGGRGVRRRPGVDHDLRAGNGPQGRDHRSRGVPRAAPGHRGRPAGRPVDRPAHQDRAVRPAAGHLRPPRRVAAAGGRRLPARGLLRVRGGGRPASPSRTAPRSSCSPTATSPTARSRGASPTPRACPTSPPPSPPSRTTPTPTVPRTSGPTSATRRPSPARGRCPARPGLEHRIGGIEKADGSGRHQLRPRQPPADDRPAGGQGGRCGRRLPAPGGHGRRGRRCAARRAGARRGVRSRPRCEHVRAEGAQGGPGAPAPPQPAAAATWATSCGGTSGPGPGDEPRAAVHAAALGVPGGRPVDLQGGRPALHRGGDRGRRSTRPSGRPRTEVRNDDHSGGGSRPRPGPTGRATRRSGGARAAATTRSSPPCSSRCPTWGCAARTSWSSAASAARPASRTT